MEEEDHMSSGLLDSLSYLSQSLENIPLYRARYNSRITDEQRMELILNELNLLGNEVENKQIETQFKANSYRFLNTISSLLIILCSAVIIGLEAASDCLNIPVVVLSSIIFAIESNNKLFRLGPLGVMYKQGSIRLKRISRQVKDYMYFFHRYSAEQLLALVSMLRAQYDDVDVGLYNVSINGAARYNTGFDLEQGGNTNPNILNPNNQNTPVLPSSSILNNFTNNSNTSTPVLNRNSNNNDSPHVHIHIDGMTPLPTRDSNDNNSNPPTLTIPSTPPSDIDKLVIVPMNPAVRKLSGKKISVDPRTPKTPIRTPSDNEGTPGKVRLVIDDVPTINVVDSDDGLSPINIDQKLI